MDASPFQHRPGNQNQRNINTKACYADRYETRFELHYDAPRMRGIAFWMLIAFRFGVSVREQRIRRY